MATQVSPGVVIKERELSSATITGALNIVGAFATTFKKGPVGEITTISTERQLIEIFGTPVENNAEDWLIASEYIAYGGRLAVVRIENDGLVNAASDTAVLVRNDVEFEAGVGGSNEFIARTAGSWANNHKVFIVDRGADQVLTLASVPPGTKIDTFSDDAVTEAGRTPGTYTPAADANGASFQVVVAQGAEILDLTDPGNPVSFDPPQYEGGAVTVTLLTAGSGYAVNDTITLTGAATGGGSDIEITVDSVSGVSPVGGQAGVINVGGVAKSVEVVAWDATAKKLTVVFDEQGVVASVGDTWEDGATDVNITAVEDWYTNASVAVGNGETLALSAIGPRPGTSNFARQRYIYNDEVHVAVVDTATNEVVERLTYLSKLTDAKSDEGRSIFFKDAINLSSQYIYHKDQVTAAGAPNSTQVGENWYQASSDITASAGSEAYLKLAYSVDSNYAIPSVDSTLTGGTDGTNALVYDSGDATTAYDLFLDTEATTIDFVLAGGSLSDEASTLAKYQAVVGVATTRKDCIAVVSPFVGNQVGTNGNVLSSSQQKTKTLNFLNQISTNSYTILGSGIKYVYDRFNDTFRWIGTNGDLAGLCVRTSDLQFDWISPAGLTRGGLRSAIKLAWNPNKADRDELYQARINPIVTFPGTGTVLFGDKTALSAPSAFDRINVRRLFLNVERRIENASKGVIFEQNDSTTRAGFASTVSSYLSEIQAKRGITDYLVVCDETNNTPEVVDRNEFVAEIFIKPVRSINYVTVTFTATRSGISFSEVVGTAG